MAKQDQHIKILQEIATLDPGTWVMGKGQYQVKTSANDIINAGKRLEELGIFNFDSKDKRDNEIIVNIVDNGNKPNKKI